MGARRSKTCRSYKGVQHVERGRSGMLVGEVKKGRTGWGVGILGRAGEVGAANVVRKRSVIVAVILKIVILKLLLWTYKENF